MDKTNFIEKITVPVMAGLTALVFWGSLEVLCSLTVVVDKMQVV